MSTAEADAVKRQALRVVHLWMDAADAAALAADPLGLRKPVELPREGDFEPTDYGDTGNLYQALYRYSRHPWYRSELPRAIEGTDQTWRYVNGCIIGPTNSVPTTTSQNGT